MIASRPLREAGFPRSRVKDEAELWRVTLVLVAILLGCNSSSSPPANSKSAAKAPVITTDAAVDVAKAPGDAELPPAPPTPAAKHPAESALAPARRIVLLTPGGPLLMDVRLTIGGEPLNDAWKQLAAAAPEQPQTPDGAADDASENDSKSSSMEPLVLRTSRAYVPDPRASSKVWAALDADHDGRLSADELAGGADRLWLLDANDDRTIAAAELASLRDQVDGNEPNAVAGPRSAGPASARLAAIELGDRLNLERLDFMLQDLYAPLQDLSPRSFAALPRLFGQLDADGDGIIVRDELAALKTIPAVLDVLIDFPLERASKHDGAEKNNERQGREGQRADEITTETEASRPQPSPRPTLTVLRSDDELKLAPTSDGRRIMLTLGKTQLAISAHDFAPRGSAEPPPDPPTISGRDPLEQSQIRLMVHDRGDALLDALDVNADGQLGEREVAAAPLRLLERDNDADGALSESEAPYQMIVAFLRHEPANAPPFSAPASGESPAFAVLRHDAPYALPRWFRAADLNSDGDLSRREFLGTAVQFRRLDSNGDGFITGVEIDVN